MTSSLIAQNRADIEDALQDYIAHTNTNSEGLFSYHISDEFLDRLATDSTNAKSGLRDMFRKVDGWNEDLQAVILNGTQTHDPDPKRIQALIDQIIPQSIYDAHGYSAVNFAVGYFVDGASDEIYRDNLKLFIGRKYRADKKKSKMFQDLAKAVGVYNPDKGSEYQKLFAQLADELNGRKLDFKLFLSINPAHILTASNPLDDKRGQCLVSCHSLNHDDYSFGTGNIGYARDNVTFVAFTVDKPDKPELLNNRKTSRQFFHYFVPGILLQNRLYNTNGGTFGEKDISKLYRDLVQRTISNADDAVNLWATRNYYNNEFGIGFAACEGFGGYPDWNKYDDGTIKISVRKDCLDLVSGTSYIIGAPSLCVACGNDIYAEEDEAGQWACDDCDDKHEICEECGRRINTDCGQWVFDSYGVEGFVCESCLFNGDYHFCEDCERWHASENCTRVTIGSIKRWVCNDCLEEGYVECQYCGDWIPEEKSFDLKDEEGNLQTVCEYCFDNHGVDCQCCGDRCFEDALDEDGYCCECWEYKHNEDDSEHTA